MSLFLVQHGDALSKAEDPERPLSGKGRGDVARMALFLARSGLRAGRVIHSGKTRAMETAKMLSQSIGPDGAVEEMAAGLAPNDPTDELLRVLQGWHEDVMIVGHEPFMGRLAARLVVGDEAGGVVAFAPGSVVCLEKSEDGNWTLQWMLRPSLFGA